MIRRVNIGNARLYGMEEDLGLVQNQYQTAVSLLFVTYLLSEVPSNLVLKRFTPSRWIAFITIVWSFMPFRMILKLLIIIPVMGSHCNINRPYTELCWPYCLPSLTWRYGRRFVPRAHTLSDSFLHQTRNCAQSRLSLRQCSTSRGIRWSLGLCHWLYGWSRWTTRVEMDPYNRRVTNLCARNSYLVYPCGRS